jgi:N-acetylmuramoyl-L-alanine amidase
LRFSLSATLAGALAIVFSLSVAGVSVHNTVNPRGIVVHHLAVPPEGVPHFRIAEIDRLHRDRGFSAFYWGRVYHIGYHFVILPDGTILRGRPERLRGAHAFGYNDYLGICLVGDFSSRDNPDGRMGLISPSEEQMRSLVKLTRDLQAKYRIPDARVVLHRELNSQTECPGDRFDKDSFLKRLAISSRY